MQINLHVCIVKRCGGQVEEERGGDEGQGWRRGKPGEGLREM